MEQEKLEKVILGLTVCSAGGHCWESDCPYKDYFMCTGEPVMRDALELLKVIAEDGQ